MSNDIAEFTKKNPSLVALEMEILIKQNEIKVLEKDILAYKKLIKFLRENRLNEGV